MEVFIKPLSGGASMQVSAAGGAEPLWTAGGRELVFREGNRMMAVRIPVDHRGAVGTPTALFRDDYLQSSIRPQYDVTSDGQRFLMVKAPGAQRPRTQFDVVVNWAGTLADGSGQPSR